MYTLNSIITFGKYENHTIEEIMQFDAQYLVWCIINLEHMLVCNTVLEKLEEHGVVNQKVEDILNNKLSLYNAEQIRKNTTYYDDYDYDTDYNDYTDYDVFNDAFEGDIDAWNHYNQ